MKLSCSLSGVKDLQRKLQKGVSKSAIQRVVRQNTGEMQAKAQRLAPVSTEKTNPGARHGDLRDSIMLEVSGDTGVVRATIDYAEYVEKGTRFMQAQPYMKPAFDAQKETFIHDLERLVKDL